MGGDFQEVYKLCRPKNWKTRLKFAAFLYGFRNNALLYHLQYEQPKPASRSESGFLTGLNISCKYKLGRHGEYQTVPILTLPSD